MVNDQLIRIHHMKLLSYNKLALEEQQRKLLGNGNSPLPAGSLASSSSPAISAPSSPIPTESLSQSAPEARLLSDQQHETHGLSPPIMIRDKKRKRFHKRNSSISNFAHHLASNNDGLKFMSDTQNRSGGGGDIATDKNGPQQQTTNKRRSTWRHLLSPSYKSRSEEFHKLFADEIPKNERLIADYSCALHREILIQGRVYISINYIAFYSNLFSWITKLVVRLRDVAEIYKANTAIIIPNAIQIVTNLEEKHVFASFIARDKSYMMIWRIWRNNLLKERMSDQEIRSLVHLSYGKDLGMGDGEELKINSPDPRTPANILLSSTDSNNNKSDNSVKKEDKKDDRTCETSGNSPDTKMSYAEGRVDTSNDESGHTRYNSVDYKTNSSKKEGVTDQAKVMSELSNRLIDFSNSQEEQNQDCQSEGPQHFNEATNLSNYSASSAVILDTPDTNNANSQLYKRDSDVTQEVCVPGNDEPLGQILTKTNSVQSEEKSSLDERESIVNNHSLASAKLGGVQSNISEETVKALSDQSLDERGLRGVGIEHQTSCANDRTLTTTSEQAEQTDEPQLIGKCDCEQHQGVQIADEEFDINVDTLFSLIFTNSKFMRSYMVKRGMTDAIVSKWKRLSSSRSGSGTNISCNSSNGGGGGGGGDGGSVGGDKSNLSTRSSSDSRGRQNSFDSFNIYLAKTPVKQKQVRQLNYSVNVNHVWAKQVQVEERQSIYSARPGVYVLKAQTINSGVPCSEAFTIDLTYCLTRVAGQLNRSRLLVHGHVNFIKDKLTWKIAMVKSMIEKESMQGVNDFIGDLIGCIREYVDKKKKKTKTTKATISNSAKQDSLSLRQSEPSLDEKTSGCEFAVSEDNSSRVRRARYSESRAQQHAAGSSTSSKRRLASATGNYATNNVDDTFDLASNRKSPTTGNARINNDQSRSHRSLARVKSKLKERKLRSMYKYYIHAPADNYRGFNNENSATNQHCATTGRCFDENLASSSDGSCCGSSESSSMSSIDDLNDTDSMIMMTTNRRPETHSQLSGTDSRSSKIRRAGGGRSFSDLETGHSAEEDDNQYDDDNFHRYEQDGNISETSNITINNGNIDNGNCRPRRAHHRRHYYADNHHRHHRDIKTTPFMYSRRENLSSSPICRSDNGHSLCRDSKHSHGRAHNLNGQRRLYRHQTPPTRSSVKKFEATGTFRSILDRVFSNRSLITLVLLVLMLLVIAMTFSHVLILRRLGSIEAQLPPNCDHRTQ